MQKEPSSEKKGCRDTLGSVINCTHQGKYTGYDVKTIPGVREAIEQHNWEEANGEIELVARTIDGLWA